MFSTIELLDRAKGRANITSDYRLAQLLGVDQSTVVGYRKGRTLPAARVMVRLADMAGVDRRAALVWLQMERSQDEAERDTWAKVSELFPPTEPSEFDDLPQLPDLPDVNLDHSTGQNVPVDNSDRPAANHLWGVFDIAL